jgi:hypothetical protein
MCAVALLCDLSELASRRHVCLYTIEVVGCLFIVMCHVSNLQGIIWYEECLAVLELFRSELCVDGTASESNVWRI